MLELGLDLIEQLLVYNGFMLSGVDLSLMNDLTQINRVGEQVIERAAPERTSTLVWTARANLDFGRVALCVQMVGKILDGGVLEILLEDVSDERGFLWIWDQPPVL